MTTTDRPVATSPDGARGPVPDEARVPEPVATSADGPARAWRSLLVAAGLYLLGAVILWWNVWSTHPTTTTTCGCGDSSLFTWFLEWPAYAISHGLNPLYSTALFHPTGVNLLSNTAEVGIGVVLAPITWLFGPIATLNVALTLAPFLSALAMFVLLRRWVTWMPAAFIGGLLYGFSPFIVIGLTDAHLMLTMAPIPPLMVACLDEILVRQRRRAVVSGVVLGLLATVQFFVGTELLVISAIAIGIGVFLLVVYGLWHAELLRHRIRHAVIGVAAAAVTAGVLLAYPVRFALAGPAHLSGNIWGAGSYTSYGGTDFPDYFLPAAPDPATTALTHKLGGYQAPTLSGQYFGLGMVLVLIVGVILWRRDRRLWLFGLLTVASVPLSFGLHFHRWTIWRLFVRLPLMENVIPSRFLIVTYLAVAVMLAVIVDHTYRDVNRMRSTGTGLWRNRSPDGPVQDAATGDTRPLAVRGWRSVGAWAGVGVAAVALLPIAVYDAPGIPLTSTPVALPQWYRTVATHLPPGQVVLSFPVPFLYLQSAMTWQAVDGMRYAMVGGGGPGTIPERAGKELAGQTELGDISVSTGPQVITAQQITATRQAFDGWGVTMVVVPDPTHLPVYEQVHDLQSIAVLLTAATGSQPVHQADAWVWSGVQQAGPAVLPPPAQLSRCVIGPAVATPASVDRATACVLAPPSTSS